jgi:hypothetical protein
MAEKETPSKKAPTKKTYPSVAAPALTKEQAEFQAKLNKAGQAQVAATPSVRIERPVDQVARKVANVDATKANVLRAITPLPINASQAVAKTFFRDARMDNNSIGPAEKRALYNTIQNAYKRTGKLKGGTEYSDYQNKNNSAQDFNNWFNKGKNPISTIADKSLSDPYYRMASTVGRGNYAIDPKTGVAYYTDVYDWNATKEGNFSGNSPYQVVRNLARGTEDKDLNVDKNDAFRMAFRLDTNEIKAEEARKERAKTADLGPKYEKGGTLKNSRPTPVVQATQAQEPLIDWRGKQPDYKDPYTNPHKDFKGLRLGNLAIAGLQTGLDQGPITKYANIASSLVNLYKKRDPASAVNMALEGVKLNPGSKIVGDAVINLGQEFVDENRNNVNYILSGNHGVVKNTKVPTADNTAVKRANGGRIAPTLYSSFKQLPMYGFGTDGDGLIGPPVPEDYSNTNWSDLAAISELLKAKKGMQTGKVGSLVPQKEQWVEDVKGYGAAGLTASTQLGPAMVANMSNRNFQRQNGIHDDGSNTMLTQTAAGMQKGAAIGNKIGGPIGTVAGSIIGGVAGAIGSKKIAEDKYKNEQAWQANYMANENAMAKARGSL